MKLFLTSKAFGNSIIKDKILRQLKKTEFIQLYTNKAKEKYKNRY